MGRCYNNNTNILFWNARGIQNKKTEFFNYFEDNIPIAILNETHLNSTTKFKCPNYCVYRSDGGEDQTAAQPS
jgi:hypothetical protein